MEEVESGSKCAQRANGGDRLGYYSMSAIQGRSNGVDGPRSKGSVRILCEMLCEMRREEI